MRAHDDEHAVVGLERRPASAPTRAAAAAPARTAARWRRPWNTLPAVVPRSSRCAARCPVEPLAVRPAVVVLVTGLLAPSPGRWAGRARHRSRPPGCRPSRRRRRGRGTAARGRRPRLASSPRSSASESPASAAAVPLIRLSPVAGLCWKTSPCAHEPGSSPAYQSTGSGGARSRRARPRRRHRRRWPSRCRRGSGRSRSTCRSAASAAAPRGPRLARPVLPVASIDHTWTMRLLW